MDKKVIKEARKKNNSSGGTFFVRKWKEHFTRLIALGLKIGLFKFYLVNHTFFLHKVKTFSIIRTLMGGNLNDN